MYFDEVEKFLKGKEIVPNEVKEEDFVIEDIIDLGLGVLFYRINKKENFCYICMDPFEGYYNIQDLAEILKLNAFKNVERNESIKKLKSEGWC